MDQTIKIVSYLHLVKKIDEFMVARFANKMTIGRS